MQKRKSKLSRSLQAISIVPLLVFGVSIIIFISHSLTQAMYNEVEVNLRNVVRNTITLFHVAYEGDYVLQEEPSVRLYKGDHELTDDFTLIDSVKQNTGMEVTLFYGDTRIITTIMDENGNRIIGTKSQPYIAEDVLNGGKSHFSTHTLINDIPYFSYYAPLVNSDGTIIGMMFVGKPCTKINAMIRSSIYPIVFTGVFAMICTSIFTLFFTKNIISLLLKIKGFLAEVSTGNLNAVLSPKVLERDDELSEIGRSAITMQSNLRKLVEQDTLTSLYNRRCGDRKLRETIHNAKTHNTPFSVVIGDLDYFKHINDTYGHDCGDMVLVNIASVLKQHIKDKGYAIRWGGEEFLLVYERLNLSNSYQELQILQNLIRELELEYDGEKITVTMTFGIVPGTTHSVTQLLRDADKKLYQGKAAGRNCISI